MLPPITVLLVTNYRVDEQKSMLRFSSFLMKYGKEIDINYKEIYPHRKLNFKHAPKKIKKWLGYADKFIIFPKKFQKEFTCITKKASENIVVHITDHSNSHYIPKKKVIPCALTCHDMIAIRSSMGDFPARQLSKTGSTLQKLICSAIPRADFIACDSHNTESDLLEICPESQGRTKTIHLGIMNSDCRPIKPQIANTDLGKTQFILHVGNSAWYKNRKSLLEAFVILTNEGSWENLHLILVGNAPTIEEITNISKESRSRIFRKVHVLNNISEPELHYLYIHARALLFPSLMEGFGWPPLEAQSFGCPVIASSAGSLSEILSDSALTIKPDDPNEIARKTSYLLKNPEMAKIIIRKGHKNAACFPIDATVKKYSDLYREVLHRTKR